MNNTTTYLVTGGAGFIGSHLVERLLDGGNAVKVLDNFSTGLETNLEKLHSNYPRTLEIIRGDIRDATLLADAVQGVQGIFHLAALVSVPQSIAQPGLSFDINARGTQLVLDAARKQGAIRVVMASSAAVYGDSQNLPLNEDEKTNPVSPYGLEKSFGEQMGKIYADLYGLDITCLRFFNVFGPRQPPDSPYSGVVSIFSKKSRFKQGPTIYGDGEQSRDFVFVGDVVEALYLSMNSALRGFRVYNIGSGVGMTVNELWSTFCRISDFCASPQYKPAREGEIRISLADICRAKADLGYRPSLDFEKNLRETFTSL